jgi:integrase
MMAKGLTAKQVENFKPRATRVELPDAGCRGLYLIIQPSGARSWAVRFRYGEKPRKLTLEPEPGAPPLTLAAARRLAADALHRVEQGADPAEQKKREKADTEAVQAKLAGDTVENLKVQFIERHAKRQNRSWRQTERIFDQLVLPAWEGRTIHEISKRDVIDLIEDIERDRPILANRVLAAVRKWFNWLAARDVIQASPCAGVVPPAKEKARERRLTDGEIKALWSACGKGGQDGCGGIGEPFGSFVRLLLLTGQRRSEVAGMRRSELDERERLWTLPGERTKNGRPHVVPLSTQATSTIEAIRPIAGSDYVFTTTGDSGLGGFSRAKERLDQQMKPAKPWTFHDLRRTAATGMADIGIQPHIIEAVLNHVSGHRAGVAGIYNRAAYAAEKADALRRWADHVDRLVTADAAAAKVISIRSQWRKS